MCFCLVIVSDLHDKPNSADDRTDECYRRDRITSVKIYTFNIFHVGIDRHQDRECHKHQYQNDQPVFWKSSGDRDKDVVSFNRFETFSFRKGVEELDSEQQHYRGKQDQENDRCR